MTTLDTTMYVDENDEMEIRFVVTAKALKQLAEEIYVRDILEDFNPETQFSDLIAGLFLTLSNEKSNKTFRIEDFKSAFEQANNDAKEWMDRKASS
jgi:molybdopterin/thiamine biosynthesis adenylyltransferase